MRGGEDGSELSPLTEPLLLDYHTCKQCGVPCADKEALQAHTLLQHTKVTSLYLHSPNSISPFLLLKLTAMGGGNVSYHLSLHHTSSYPPHHNPAHNDTCLSPTNDPMISPEALSSHKITIPITIPYCYRLYQMML